MPFRQLTLPFVDTVPKIGRLLTPTTRFQEQHPRQTGYKFYDVGFKRLHDRREDNLLNVVTVRPDGCVLKDKSRYHRGWFK